MGWDAAGRRSQISPPARMGVSNQLGQRELVMSAGLRVASKRSHADRISFGVILTLALLPACSPERLVLFTVDRAQGLHEVIAKLEVRTSLTGYRRGQHEDTTDDAGNTMFPKTVGVYVHARSGLMNVRVFAYSPDDKLVAAGEREVRLEDERDGTISSLVVLQSCSAPAPDNMTPCQMSAPPDGGDGGADADGGIVVS